MARVRTSLLTAAIGGLLLTAAAPEPAPVPSVADILAASQPGEWRSIDPDNLLVMELPKGRVIIELAPAYAPSHVANIRALIRAGYFDDSAVVRSQDNYVVQWVQPDEKRSLGPAQKTLKAEFDRPLGRDVHFDALPDSDTYAAEVGFADGFPAARDNRQGRTWLTHCYGMVGVARDNGADSGGGTELYAVNGQSPRHLDRNVTMVGRVIEGMELLSVIPRGTEALGFYKTPAENTPIRRIRVASDLPPAERPAFEALKTGSATFRTLTESRRNRRDAWFHAQAGAIGVCNVPLPVRKTPG